MHGVPFLRQIVPEMKLFDLEEKSVQKEGGKSGYRPKFVFEIWLCPCTNKLICHFTDNVYIHVGLEGKRLSECIQ